MDNKAARVLLLLLILIGAFMLGRQYERQVLVPPDISGNYVGPRMAPAGGPQ